MLIDTPTPPLAYPVREQMLLQPSLPETHADFSSSACVLITAHPSRWTAKLLNLLCNTPHPLPPHHQYTPVLQEEPSVDTGRKGGRKANGIVWFAIGLGLTKTWSTPNVLCTVYGHFYANTYKWGNKPKQVHILKSKATERPTWESKLHKSLSLSLTMQCTLWDMPLGLIHANLCTTSLGILLPSHHSHFLSHSKKAQHVYPAWSQTWSHADTLVKWRSL